MLKLLCGTDWTANRDEVLRRVAQDVRDRKPGRILLVPESVSHDMERRLAAVAGDTCSRYAQVLSFSRLASRVCDELGSGAKDCLDGGGRIVAMASAADQVNSRLKAYGNVQKKPEFLADLVSTMDEFKRCCVSSEDLEAAIAHVDSALAQKMEELALLLRTYDGICARGKRDPRDLMTWVCDHLPDIPFIRNAVFYVDGFPDFTQQNMEILQQLIALSQGVTVTVTWDHAASNLAFAQTAKTAGMLTKLGEAVSGKPVEMETIPARNVALAPVWQRLFQGATRQTAGVAERLRAFRGESVHQECQAVAEAVLDLVQNRHCRYRDISLVCADMEGYRKTLQLVFRKCGIPLYLAGTEDILRSGAMTTVLLALECVAGDFEQKLMLRYLRSALSPLEQELCDLVENHAVIWRISGKGWEEAWTQHPDGLSGVWEDAAYEKIALLEEARQQVMTPLLRLRQGLHKAENVGSQVQCLYDFLQDIHYAQRLGDYADYMESNGNPRGAQILNQLWEILLTALEQLHDVLGNTFWDSKHFSRLLTVLLSQYDVGTIPPVLDAVTAGAVSAMRCQQEKHLFILGAREGSLPGYGSSTGVLTAQERKVLIEKNLRLGNGAEDQLMAEFFEIYSVFCGADETITLSCCDAQPSFVYRRIAQMAGHEAVVKPVLGSALVHKDAAGAWLSARNAQQEAKQLGVLDAYCETQKRKTYRLGNVNPETIRALYGKRLTLSASQVDQQAMCKMAYFLKYGLRARERREATVDPAEYGTYVHAVLEKTAREVMAAGGFDYVSLEDTLAMARRHSHEYAQERFGQLGSSRVEYLFRRNMEELEMVVHELWRELSAAAYKPREFELHFAEDGQMPPVQINGSRMPAVLRGFVDRVDIWQQGESTYFRVVDYKTGKKDFDYCDVFNGVGLQMLLYLFALEDGGKMIAGDRRVSAGIQYFPARAPYVSADGALTPEEAETQRRKEWTRPGLLLSDEASLAAMDPSEDMALLHCARDKNGNLTGDVADRQQLGLLKRYIMGLLGKMVDEIASGDIQANPYTRGTSFNACTFCPYGNICHRETVTGRRNYKAVKAGQFWEDVRREVDSDG